MTTTTVVRQRGYHVAGPVEQEPAPAADFTFIGVQRCLRCDLVLRTGKTGFGPLELGKRVRRVTPCPGACDT